MDIRRVPICAYRRSGSRGASFLGVTAAQAKEITIWCWDPISMSRS